MWCSDVDLHSHSTHSDGTLDVATLAASMAREGVRVWSLTDHDTTSGWEDAAEQANLHGMAFLPGVELTCVPALSPSADAAREGSWHLLAYFPTPMDAPEVREIRAWIAGLTEARGPRMSMMIERLATFGIHVDEAKVLARADGAVGRPHLAAELLEMGVVETFQQAFDDWIGDGAPANVERPRPDLGGGQCTGARRGRLLLLGSSRVLRRADRRGAGIALIVGHRSGGGLPRWPHGRLP